MLRKQSILSAFVILGLLGLQASESLAQPPAQKKKQSTLRVAKETTRIVEPLDDEGYVDYVAAVNRIMSRGVTPQNNYEVVAQRVLGPDQVPDSIKKEFYRALEIPLPKGPFLKDLVPILMANPNSLGGKDAFDVFSDMVEKPWTADQYPIAEKWLSDWQPQLDQLAKACLRDRCYAPFVADGDPANNQPKLISVLLPSAQGHRNVARLLLIRANYNLGEGHLAEAWSDIHAVMRLSRLSTQGITLIDQLVGIAIGHMSHESAVQLLNHKDLTTELLQRIDDDLKEVSKYGSIADKIDIGERFMGLDAVQTLSRHANPMQAMQAIQALAILNPEPEVHLVWQKEKQPPKPVPGVPQVVVNWNQTAIYINGWYDRLVEAAREEGFEMRSALFDKIEVEVAALGRGNNGMLSLMKAFGEKNVPDALGKKMGEILAALLIPAIESAANAQFRGVQEDELLRFAVAAELMRRTNNRVPKSITEIEKHYGMQMTPDRFADKPITFHASNNGIVMYSVGQNGKDDLGRSRQDAEQREGAEWDDIVVRLKF